MANILEREKTGNSVYESPGVKVIQIVQDVVRTSTPEAGGEDNADWWE